MCARDGMTVIIFSRCVTIDFKKIYSFQIVPEISELVRIIIKNVNPGRRDLEIIDEKNTTSLKLKRCKASKLEIRQRAI